MDSQLGPYEFPIASIEFEKLGENQDPTKQNNWKTRKFRLFKDNSLKWYESEISLKKKGSNKISNIDNISNIRYGLFSKKNIPVSTLDQNYIYFRMTGNKRNYDCRINEKRKSELKNFIEKIKNNPQSDQAGGKKTKRKTKSKTRKVKKSNTKKNKSKKVKKSKSKPRKVKKSRTKK